MAVFKLRRGTAGQWTAANTILASGEPGLETDTRKIKMGDGTSPWNTLEYVEGALPEALVAQISAMESDITDLASGLVTLDDGIDAVNSRLTNETLHTASKLGPVSTDFSSVNLNIPSDAVTYNRQYALGAGGRPANWPVDEGAGLQFIVAQGSYNLYAFGSINAMTRSLRVMCDGDKFCWYIAAGAALTGMMIYIDGRPTSLTPYATGVAGQFHSILFPSAKPRLIEIVTAAPLSAVYTQKQYDLWKPAPVKGPRVLVIGDSYVAGSGVVTSLVNGIYHNIGPHIGSEDVWIDAQGGTGYGVTSHADGVSNPQNRYLDRINRLLSGQTWDIGTIDPDMIVVHGGGANDKYKGRTNEQVIADVVSMFTQLRAECPKAKLVFVEGFAPPLFTPETYNPNYIAIRQGAQAALTSVGVYYIDVATTDPWIKGTGRVGATTGVGNSDIYVGTDNVHLVDAGHLYVRGRMAEKLKQVLNDNGALVNQLF